MLYSLEFPIDSVSLDILELTEFLKLCNKDNVKSQSF